jgi:hypothetical protein
MCRGSIPFPIGVVADESQRHVSFPLRLWSDDPCAQRSLTPKLSCLDYGMKTLDVETISVNHHNAANQSHSATPINRPRSFSSLEFMSPAAAAAFSFAAFKAVVLKTAAVKAASASKATAENVALVVGTAAATWELYDRLKASFKGEMTKEKFAELVGPKLAKSEQRIADLEDENSKQKFVIEEYEASTEQEFKDLQYMNEQNNAIHQQDLKDQIAIACEKVQDKANAVTIEMFKTFERATENLANVSKNLANVSKNLTKACDDAYDDGYDKGYDEAKRKYLSSKRERVDDRSHYQNDRHKYPRR